MSSFFSHSSHGSGPAMNQHRTGNGSVYYDKEGRVYYKGKDLNDNHSSPPMSPSRYDNHTRNGDVRQHHARAPPRSNASYDQSRRPSGDDLERDLASKGYRVVAEETYDPKTGRKETRGSPDRYRSNDRRDYSHDRKDYSSDRRDNSYSRDEREYSRDGRDYSRNRRDDRDVYSTDGSHAYSHSSRPLPTLPREANRRDGNRSREDWHEMNGYSQTLPRDTKDKDRLFESDSRAGDQSNDHKIHYYVPFIFFGFFIMICGVMNILFCDKFQYYFRFWVGALVFAAGVIGAIHKGNYTTAWKNILFIVACFIATAASLVGFALSMRHLIPETVLLSAMHNASEYVKFVAPHDTYSNVKNDDVVVWVCYVFNWVTVPLLIASLTTLSVAIVVLDKYWSENYYYTQVAEPFCLPPLFNPFGQMQLGEVVCMMGLLTVYACVDSDYMDYWSPVWAGAVSILAGLVAGVAMKRHDLQIWSISCLITEVLAAGATVAAIVLCALGMVKNVSETKDKQTNLEEDLSIASATIYAVTIAICLINIFFCLAQIVRMVTYLCAPSHSRRRRLSVAASGRSFSDIGYPHVNSGPYRTNVPEHHNNNGYAHSRTIERMDYSHQNGRNEFSRY